MSSIAAADFLIPEEITEGARLRKQNEVEVENLRLLESRSGPGDVRSRPLGTSAEEDERHPRSGRGG